MNSQARASDTKKGRSSFHRDARGKTYVEYLIVTITVSFAMAVAIVKLGPGLVKHHREVVKTVVEKAP